MIHLTSEAEYRTYFDLYVPKPLRMKLAFEEINTFVDPDYFDHAFFESSHRDKVKDQFSFARASRMDEIAGLLLDPNAKRLAGWDNTRKRYDHSRCVILGDNEFVVIVGFHKTRSNKLKSRLITNYVADNSYWKILQSPIWSETNCRS